MGYRDLQKLAKENDVRWGSGLGIADNFCVHVFSCEVSCSLSLGDMCLPWCDFWGQSNAWKERC